MWAEFYDFRDKKCSERAREGQGQIAVDQLWRWPHQTPHVHNLGFLRTQAVRIDMRLVDAWRRERREDRACFEKLTEAYVKARYSKLCRAAHYAEWARERPAFQQLCADRLGIVFNIRSGAIDSDRQQ